MVDVLVLTVAGCPQVDGFVPHLRALVATSGVPADVVVEQVDDAAEAERLGFLGSPTVRVGGRDVEPGATGRSPGLCCRVYDTSAGVTPTPPDGWVLAALGAAVTSASAERWDTMLVRGPQPVVPELVDDDGERPRRFAAHRERLLTALGERARLVEHIGSTAVPGLAAKPVTDVVVGIDDPDDEDAYLPDLLAVGYELRVVEPGHRCLRDVTGEPANVHCYAPADTEVTHYLLLRDHLRTHPEAVRTYADAKRALAGREWPDINAYADAKGPTIRVLLADALTASRTRRGATSTPPPSPPGAAAP